MTQKILVVDDSRTVRTVVEWVFHGSPYTIISAATASDAVRMMREHRPSVALIDYSLPDQSGFELCQEIRKDRDLSSIPLVMMGGTWGGFDETRAAACADDYIYKPFKTDALIEKVSTASSRASARPAQLTPADARTIAGMPAMPPVGGLPGAPPLPPLQAPAPPPAPQPASDSGGGFRRVQSGPEVAGSPGLQVGPPPLPQIKGPPPSPTPLPAPMEEQARAAAAAALPPIQPPAPPQPPAAPAVPPQAPVTAPLSPEASRVPAPLPQIQPPAPATPPAAEPAPLPAAAPLPPAPEPAAEPEPEVEERAAAEPTAQTAAVEPAVLPAAPVEIDEAQVREMVREMLPPIVKEVLAGLLRQTIGTRVEAYATKKIDSFIESELPTMAEKAIDAQLQVLYANVDE